MYQTWPHVSGENCIPPPLEVRGIIVEEHMMEEMVIDREDISSKLVNEAARLA